MDKDLKETIFTYLDKRHTIEGNTVYFKDKRPFKRTEDLFGVNVSWDFVDKWVQSRIGKEYCFIYPSGIKAWYMNGELHREGGPAYIHPDGQKEWFINGNRHRLDGPAVIWEGDIKDWFIDGRYYNEKNFNKRIKELNG